MTTATPPAPALAAVPRTDVVLLGVAIASVSLSAPLIAATAAPALAIAFWRNALAVGALTPVAWFKYRARLRALTRREVGLTVGAGALLALHFGLWLPSLSMTSVASSTALCTTTPIWTTIALRLRGHRPPALVWTGTLAACVGVVLLTGVDLSPFAARAGGTRSPSAAALAAAGLRPAGRRGAQERGHRAVHLPLLRHGGRGAAHGRPS